MKNRKNLLSLHLNFNILLMSQKIVIRFLIFCILPLSLFSCKKELPQRIFTVEGTVSHAEGKTLYLERTSVLQLDSAVLDSTGQFRLKAIAPESTDFYRLRLGGLLINFVADSTETIRVESDAPLFSRDYAITGSAENEKIKELAVLQQDALIRYKKLRKEYDEKQISADKYFENLNEVIRQYKDNAKAYIINDFSSPSAYFALFQQVDNMLIFDPYDRDDNKYFGAVANNSTDSIRREHVKGVYLNGLAFVRGEGEKEFEVKEVSSKEAFDLSLPGMEGKEIRLSEVADNKLTLIDFTVYGAAESPEHNINLAELYRKYNAKGFEIYQVALDPDEHLWKNAAYSIPWVTVRDPESIYSSNLKKYNVNQIPTTYLRDKDGEIVLRVTSYEDLEKALRKYLN